MMVIVVNSGSSSIKYETFDLASLSAASKGLLERIGTQDSRLRHRWLSLPGRWEEIIETRPVADHREGFSFILEVSGRSRPGREAPEIFGVGHRVVHGGEKFREPAIIDDATLGAIEDLIPLAPLHNPANVTGIKVMRDLLPQVPQVAVFDTAFHQSMPPKAFHYALPYDFYQSYGVRRYGFHGSSHRYVTAEASRHLGVPSDQLNLITLHLGNGASATAVEQGKSIDTSMGLTPLEGLIMGTRCGDLDPAVHFYLARKTGRAVGEIEGILNKESGLKGICGSNDMREIQDRAQKGDARAELALEMFCYRVRKYIGAYYAVLGTVDAVVFTGGIGENSALVRSKTCEGLSGLGITLDEGRNSAAAGGISEIHAGESRVKVLVIPTNEEREIAQQTVGVIKRMKGPGLMTDARNYMAQETLKNGLGVTIRAIRPGDRDAVLAALKELDERTVYLRFFGPKQEFSHRELTEATDVDFVRTFALVTCVRDGAEEKIIGAGRYIAFGDTEPPDKAEVAFTVEEDYHGLGIAGRLLKHLAEIGKQQGVKEFHAEVLPGNKGMLAVFNKSGFPVKQEFVEGLAHVTMLLAGDRQ